MISSPPARPRAGRREWTGLVVLALPTLLLSLDLSALYLVLPKMAGDLRPNSSESLWIMDIYGFMLAGFLITMGSLGDRIGRRKLLLIGAAVFGLASVAAAFSTSVETLILSRAFMGVAAATMMPSTLALITNMFKDTAQRALAIGVWTACFVAGMATGPLIGGAMLQFFWWGSVFLLGTPLLALLLVVGPILLPEYRDRTATGRMDLFSVGCSLAAILPVIYGLQELARTGVRAGSIVAIAVGVVFGVVFVRRQRSLAHPLLDIALFKNRVVRVALGVMLFSTLTMGGLTLLVNQYLQLVEGATPLQAGLWLVPSTVGTVVGSVVAPLLLRVLRPAHLVGGGLTVAVLGLLLLTQAGGTNGLAIVLIGYSIVFIGVSPMGVLGTSLVIGSAPASRAGVTASVSETTANFGIALGIAVLGSVCTVVYRGQMATATFPADLPNLAVADGRDTLADVVSATDRFPGDGMARLLAEARDAFSSGVHVVVGVMAAVLLAYATFAFVQLRRVPAGGTAMPDQEQEALPSRSS